MLRHLDLKLLQTLCSKFGLDTPVQYALFQSRLMHDVWKIETCNEKFYALKSLNDTSFRWSNMPCFDFDSSIHIAENFQRLGLPCFESLKASPGSFVCQTQGCATFACAPWISAAPNQALSLDKSLLIAKMLAKIHADSTQSQLKSKKWVTVSGEPSHPPWVEMYHHFKALSKHPELADQIQSVSEMIHHVAQGFEARTSVISHRDLGPYNVLWKDDLTPVIIDWELAGPIAPELDLLATALSWSLRGQDWTLDLDYLDAFLEAYFTSEDTLLQPWSCEQFRGILFSVLGMWMDWIDYCVYIYCTDKTRAETALEEMMVSLGVIQDLANHDLTHSSWSSLSLGRRRTGTF